MKKDFTYYISSQAYAGKTHAQTVQLIKDGLKMISDVCLATFTQTDDWRHADERFYFYNNKDMLSMGKSGKIPFGLMMPNFIALNKERLVTNNDGFLIASPIHELGHRWGRKDVNDPNSIMDAAGRCHTIGPADVAFLANRFGAAPDPNMRAKVLASFAQRLDQMQKIANGLPFKDERDFNRQIYKYRNQLFK